MTYPPTSTTHQLPPIIYLVQSSIYPPYALVTTTYRLRPSILIAYALVS